MSTVLHIARYISPKTALLMHAWVGSILTLIVKTSLVDSALPSSNQWLLRLKSIRVSSVPTD